MISAGTCFNGAMTRCPVLLASTGLKAVNRQ